MRQRAPLALLALAAQLGCGPQEAPPVTLQAYPYYFYESTGPNNFIMRDGTEHNFTFDREDSDPDALEALDALKWNVVYPNSKGKITLIGTHHPDQGTFSLQHWTLATPFDKYVGDNPLAEPVFLTTRVALVPDDFDQVIKHDPRIYHEHLREGGSGCD